jgi:hypothetical protein
MENRGFIKELLWGGDMLLIQLPDRAKDKICIFGFSRGAYTARAFSMIRKVCVREHDIFVISLT